MSDPIKAICIPILNRGDLLLNCVTSMRHDIEKLVIVNNGDDPSVAAAINSIRNLPFVHEVFEHRSDVNMGVSASWNWFFRNHSLPYYFICSNDLIFSPGDLEKVQWRIRSVQKQFFICAHSFNAFVVLPSCIREIGYFDENFYPAYCEDCDYWRRIVLWEREHSQPVTTPVDGVCIEHLGSQTIHSDIDVKIRVKIGHADNLQYYKQKWGGFPGEEQFSRPFNCQQNALSYWPARPDC